ncbi:MAG: sigma-70 family RNA polymerase sigma factor [Planctomycetota bacterium]
MSNPPPHLDRILGEADRLQRLAYSILRDAHGAEDVAQEASLIAIDRAPTGLDDGTFRAWIGAVARNLALNRQKRHRSRARRESEVARNEASTGQAEAQERLETQRAMAEAVLGLGETEREIVVLRYLDGLPPRVIAERVGRTPAAVSSVLHRSLQKLKERLAADGYGVSALALVARRPSRATTVGRGLSAGVGTGSAVAVVWGLGAAALVTLCFMFVLGESSKTPGGPTQERPALEPSIAVGSGGRSNHLGRLSEPMPDTLVDREPALAADPGLLSVPEPYTLTLRVRVIDARGRPIRGAAVGPVVVPTAEPVVDSRPRVGRFRIDTSMASRTGQDGTAAIVLPWHSDAEFKGQLPVILIVACDGWTEAIVRETFETPGEFSIDDVELARAGTATGRVLDDQGRPVSGFFVAAVGPSTPGSPETERQRREQGQAFVRLRHPAQAVRTDASGAFHLDRIPVGQVSLIAGAPGESYGYSSPVEIREGAVTAGVEVVVPRATREEAAVEQEASGVAASHARTMTVCAVDEGGAAVEEAFVGCLQGAGPVGKFLPVQSTSTGPGKFELNPPAETFSVIVNARGYEHSVVGPFELGRVPEVLNVTLKRSTVLRGVVVDAETKRPLAGAKVHAHVAAEGGLAVFRSGLRTRWQPRSSSALSLTADDEGRFELPLPGFGERLIHVECEGYARATFGPVVIASVAAQPEPVIGLQRGATLRGRLLVHEDVDPTLFSVEISQSEGHLTRSAIGEDGSYSFEHLPAASVQIRRLRRPGKLDLRTRRSARGSDVDLRTQAMIPDDGEVVFDLDYRHEVPVELDLRVALDGEWESGWKAFLSLDGEDPHGSTQLNWQEKPVPASGSLRMIAVGSGTARLTLRRVTPSFGEQSLSCAWPARAGVNPRKWSSPTGLLTLSGLPALAEERDAERTAAQAGPPGFALYQDSGNGWEWIERFDPTEAGEQRLREVPVGTLQIRRRGNSREYDVLKWQVIGEAEVRAGDETLLEIESER